MNPDELDKVLREFRKDHPPRQIKRHKRSQRKNGMDQLVHCIEQQLEAAFSDLDSAPPVA